MVLPSEQILEPLARMLELSILVRYSQSLQIVLVLQLLIAVRFIRSRWRVLLSGRRLLRHSVLLLVNDIDLSNAIVDVG